MRYIDIKHLYSGHTGKNNLTNLPNESFDTVLGSFDKDIDYIINYEKSVDSLFRGLLDGVPSNTICYPLLFLMRHTLELGYKYNIYSLSKYTSLTFKELIEKYAPKLKIRNDKLIEHSLHKLHFLLENLVKEISEFQDLSSSDSKLIQKPLESIRNSVFFFQQLDTASESFRYSKNWSLVPLIKQKGGKLNLLEAKNHFDDCMLVLNYNQISNVVEHYLKLQDEYESVY